MKCPECGHKLSTKNYDATFEWYECPKCEGCFTYDEILEGGIDESSESEDAETQGNSRSKKSKKTGRGNGSRRKNASRKNKTAPARAGKRVVAKGKKRREEIEEDEAVIAEYEEKISTPVKSSKETVHHRDELATGEVIGIWGDEIQEIYAELGAPDLDDVNARDKALIIWRETRYMHGGVAREQAVEHAVCQEHS